MSDGKHDKEQPSREKREHGHHLDTLTDALMSGDEIYVVKCLREFDRVDGEPLDVLIRLFEGDQTLRKQQFPKRLKFVGWKRGGPPRDHSLKSADDPESSDLAAWKSGDENHVVKWLRELTCLEGEALNVMAHLLEGDLNLKAHFPKRLKFAGWGRGRPPFDESLKAAEDANLVHLIKHRLKQGHGLESVIVGLMKETKLSRSSLFKIWGARPRKVDLVLFFWTH